MGQRLDYRDIAKSVIQTIQALEPRFRVPGSPAELKVVVDSWERVLKGRVWPDEAVEAVTEHYAQPNAFQIMPGDVVAYCQKQPPWSSEAHAHDFLAHWVRFPHSNVIELYTGIQPPVIAIPDSVDRSNHRDFMVTAREKWLRKERERLVRAMMAKRYRGVEFGA